MAELILRLPSTEKKRFEEKVGKGNMSKTIRMYIQSCICKDKNDIIQNSKIKRLEMMKVDLDLIQREYITLKAEVESVDRVKRQKEIDNLKKEEETEKRELRDSERMVEGLKSDNPLR